MTDKPMTRPTPAALLPCPFCGGIDVRIVQRDVEPQGDPWYGKKIERIVECNGCGATMFDRYWHEGFFDDESAIAAWNRRAPTTADALIEAHAKAREQAEDAIEEQRQEERTWPRRR